jgi:hypothetical protein
MQLSTVSINQTHVHFHYQYDTRYNELLPQDSLSAEGVLSAASHQKGSAEHNELIKLLKKSLVIGGDTGKRSTFTLTYNFALGVWDDNSLVARKLQTQSILDFKYGTHLSLKYQVRNYEFATACIKHFDYELQKRFFQRREKRSIEVVQHAEYQAERNRQREEMRRVLYSRTLEDLILSRDVPGLPSLNYGRIQGEQEQQRFREQTFSSFWANIQSSLKAKKRSLLYNCIVSHFIKTLLKQYYVLQKLLVPKIPRAADEVDER